MNKSTKLYKSITSLLAEANKILEPINDLQNKDYDEICRYFDTGKIQQFYPPLGKNPYKKFYVLIPVAAFALGLFATILLFPKTSYNGKRGNLEKLALTVASSKSQIS